LIALVLAACAAPEHGRESSATAQAVAPSGTLRVGVSVGPTGNTFRATPDPATNLPKGVPVDLGGALGQRLGVPVELMAYPTYEGLLDAGSHGAWDVTFLPLDEERAKVLDYGPAYYLLELTYLVPAGSRILAQSEVDRPGVRIAVVEKSVSAQNREQFLKSAKLIYFKSLEDVREQLRTGNVDAAAAGRESLLGLAGQLPGARVLDGGFHITNVAVAVPKNRPAALRFVSEFIENAKANGVVRHAFDNAGFKDAAVAPAVPRK
jgi:polar amino acid transport system substrate-binding protein